MRKLATAALAFSVAVFAANYILPVGWLPYLALIFGAVGAALLCMRRKWLRGIIIALLGFGVGLGVFYIHYLRFSLPAQELDGETREISGKLLEYPQVYEDYCRARILVDCEGIPGFEALVYDSSMGLSSAQPGQLLSFSGSIESADIRYGQDYDYYNSRDIYLVINTKSTPVVTEGGFELSLLPVRISAYISKSVDELFPEDTAPFMKALLLGDKTQLYEDEGLHLAMSRAGLMHIVAVSGMHIAFLVGFLQLLLGSTRKSSILCIALVWLFVLITGSGHSALRAAVMQTYLLMAPVLRRENDSLTSLSTALALILLINPYAAASVSLQLSFGAMAGIMAFSGKISASFCRSLPSNIWGRVLGYILNIAAGSLSVMVFTLPLMAIHFGYLSLLSPLSNVLALWAVSLVFCGGFAVLIFGLVFPGLGIGAAWLVSWLVRYIFLTARMISAIPFAAVYLKSSLAVYWLLLCYLLFAIAALCKEGKGSRFLLPTLLSLLTLFVYLGASRLSYRMGEGVISVLDVGQGQCISVFSGESSILIDCGGMNSLENAGETAGAYLNACGRDRVDVLVLSHLHADHANGVSTLLEMTEVERIIMPENPIDEDGLLEDILQSAASHGTQVEFLAQDVELSIGGISLRLFKPGTAGDENERCIMALCSLGDYDMLVTGDSSKSAERELIEEHTIEDVELLIVGHHGSRYSSSGELLSQIGGENAIISVGYNSYGHPTNETLERLAAYGYNVLRTDLNGTIQIRVGNDYGEKNQ